MKYHEFVIWFNGFQLGLQSSKASDFKGVLNDAETIADIVVKKYQQVVPETFPNSSVNPQDVLKFVTNSIKK